MNDQTSGRVIAPSPLQWQSSEQAEITRLNTQLDAGHRWLRFTPALEKGFRRDYEEAARDSRTVLIVLSLVMVAITPLYDVSLLQAPPAFAHFSHLVQWCVMLPMLTAMLLVQRSSRSSAALRQSLAICTLFAIWAGLTSQRALAGYYGFHFPHDYGVVSIIGGFAMARLIFYRYLPWAFLMLVASIGVELLRSRLASEQTLSAPINDSMSMTMLWLLGATGAWLFEHVSRSAWLRHEIYHRLAIHDTLTGLSNRHHFQAQMDRLIRQASRERKPIGVMLIDVDHFKAYNDRYGHVAGDDCLRRIGSWLCVDGRRPLDLRARIGGEEFVAVWYGIEAGEIAELAESLREGIAGLGIVHDPSPTLPHVTASAGLIHGVPGAGITADSLMREADTLLYAAKEAGRSRLNASFGLLAAAASTSSTVVPFTARAGDAA